jgi:hypothetical protein
MASPDDVWWARGIEQGRIRAGGAWDGTIVGQGRDTAPSPAATRRIRRMTEV